MKNIKTGILLCIAFLPALLCGCAVQNEKDDAVTVQSLPSETEEETASMNAYEQISQEQAKHIMDTESGYIIVDVRERDEYDAGHIPGAVLMPYTQTRQIAPELLPDKDALILVYCRSGRRSKIAAAELADMGYTDVREFGGIIDWPYETE